MESTLRERFAGICLALTEPGGGPRTGQHDGSTMHGKKFAYFLNDHHGDGRVEDLGDTDWALVERLVTDSYVLHAPKKLAVLVGGEG